ncbi:MAG: hypothetical protein M3245_05290 [Actinomycetota bacterium]|nr:hypothetical protein [Actinomycetota bacterium]
MRSPLDMLRGAAVPALLALAVVPGEAAAATSYSSCSAGFTSVPTSLVRFYATYDYNRNGLVCAKPNKGGAVSVNDDRVVRR